MRAVNFLIKPASSLCNLRCRYCFYEDEAENRAMPSMGIMSRETVEVLIRQAYGAVQPGGLVSFAFQGGEPTVAGLPFFRGFVELARELKPKAVNIAFSIQTNGILLDESWVRFLREEDFLVGISLDGYKELHNTHRIDASGEGTWNRVTASINLLNKHRVKVNALCVVTGACAKHPQRAYQTLKKLGFDYLQFIACLDPIGLPRGQMPWSLRPEAYGQFLCQLFDLWYRDWETGQYHSIRLFDDYIHILLGDGGSTCATCGRCGEYFVVEGDGSVYPCDFYALDRWKIGELRRQTLEEMRRSEPFLRFSEWGREKPAECLRCQWRFLCNGGCKNDWVSAGDGVHNYYCQSFRMLFAQAADRMKRIAQAEWSARRGR